MVAFLSFSIKWLIVTPMAIPKFDELFTDVLQYLSDGKVHKRRPVYEAVVERRNLTPEELAEKLKGGSSRAEGMVYWAVQYLVYAEAVNRPSRGEIVITDLGRTLLADHPDGITLADLEKTAGLQDWYKRTIDKRKAKKEKSSSEGDEIPNEDSSGVTPLEDL